MEVKDFLTSIEGIKFKLEYSNNLTLVAWADTNAPTIDIRQ
jgi:hypothetical protein